MNHSLASSDQRDRSPTGAIQHQGGNDNIVIISSRSTGNSSAIALRRLRKDRPTSTTEQSKVYNVHLAPVPRGNASTRALRRLRKDRPDIHKQVIAGTLSPHAGMVQAGFRTNDAPRQRCRLSPCRVAALLPVQEWPCR